MTNQFTSGLLSGVMGTLLIELGGYILRPHLHFHCTSHGYRAHRLRWQACDICEAEAAQKRADNLLAMKEADAALARIDADPILKVMAYWKAADSLDFPGVSLVDLGKFARRHKLPAPTAKQLRERGAKSFLQQKARNNADNNDPEGTEFAVKADAVRVWKW